MVQGEFTFLLGFVDRFVSLDEDGGALAVDGDCGVVVEDVPFLCQVPVAPNLQVCLSTKP